MQNKVTIRHIIALLAVFAFLAGMASTPFAAYVDSDTGMVMAVNDEERQDGEAPFYFEGDRLQDDLSGPDDSAPDLENLTDEELRLYREMIESQGK